MTSFDILIHHAKCPLFFSPYLFLSISLNTLILKLQLKNPQDGESSFLSFDRVEHMEVEPT